MARYRMKPVEKEAWSIRELWDTPESNMDDRVRDAMYQGIIVEIRHGGISVVTAEGTMTATADDYLVLGLQGEWYPVMRSVFEKSYEKVSD